MWSVMVIFTPAIILSTVIISLAILIRVPLQAFLTVKDKKLSDGQNCLHCLVIVLNVRLKQCVTVNVPKNRFIITPEGEPGLNYLCSGYKIFFNHCRPFVEAIATVSGKPDTKI